MESLHLGTMSRSIWLGLFLQGIRLEGRRLRMLRVHSYYHLLECMIIPDVSWRWIILTYII